MIFHHLICQDPTQLVLVKQGQPAKANQLVRFQLEPANTHTEEKTPGEGRQKKYFNTKSTLIICYKVLQ